MSSGQLFPRTSLRAENAVLASLPPGMILQVTVHSIDGFDDYAGFMDRTDPYVLLQVGKLKHKTSIKQDNGGKDVFVHISAVERAGLKALNENQKIGFELQSGRDGKESAGDLRLL